MIEQSFETPTPLRLDLRIPGGRIEVEAAEVAATDVYLDGPDDLAERATIELRGDELRVEVRARKGLFVDFGRPEYDLRVRCPEGSTLHTQTKSADLGTRGRLAAVTSESASGDTRLERVETARVHTASGDVFVGAATGEVEIGTASGDAEVGRASRVVVNVVSGDVRIVDADGPVSVQSVSGDVRIDAVTAGTISVEAVSGDVRVGARRGSLVHVDASTLSGHTHSELDLGGVPVGHDDGGAQRLELRLNTVSGDISVVRAATATPQEV